MALNKREWKPKEEIAKMLDEKYPQLGDLTKDEFTALKYLIQQDKSFLIIDNIDLKTIQIKDGEDKWRDATVDDIEPHDDIRANITLTRKGEQVTNRYIIKDIKNAQFDPKTGYLVLDTDTTLITDNKDIQSAYEKFSQAMDRNEDVKLMRGLVNDGKIELSEFKELRDATYADIKDMIDRASIERETKARDNLTPEMESMFLGEDSFGNDFDKDSMDAENERRADEFEESERTGNDLSTIQELK